MGDFSDKTIKWLFGPASHCAFPGCQERITQRIDGKLVVVAQIAHIRSEEAGGPRHDPAYALPNGFENLLLVCGKHHKLIDDHPADYPVELLEEWKTVQLDGRAADEKLSADDLAVIVAHFMSSTLEAFTAVNLEVSLVGGVRIGGSLAKMPLNMINNVKVDGIDLEKFVGVSVSNRGLVAVEVDGAGFDLDFSYDYDPPVFSPLFMHPGPAREARCPLPYRLLSHAGANWFEPIAFLSGAIAEVAKSAHVIDRVRAYVTTGSGIRVESDWVPAIDVPMWTDGFTADDLVAMQELAKEAQAQVRGSQGAG